MCVKPVQNSGTLPLLVEAVLSVSIGCVSARSTKLQRPLDSYQVCENQIQIVLMNKQNNQGMFLYSRNNKRQHCSDNMRRNRGVH